MSFLYVFESILSDYSRLGMALTCLSKDLVPLLGLLSKAAMALLCVSVSSTAMRGDFLGFGSVFKSWVSTLFILLGVSHYQDGKDCLQIGLLLF